MDLQTLVTTETLQQHLQDPEWIIFDCRFSLADTSLGEHNYNLSHISGAHYAHLDRDLSSPVTANTGRHPLPAAGALADTLGRFGLRNNMQVVVYDDSNGSIAVRLWWMLRWLGHFSVALLDGGLQKWQREGRPVDSLRPTCRPGEFHGVPDRQKWFSTDEIEQAVSAESICLLDARTPERYRGELEPIDTVAGHVPGALNHSFDQNLQDNGEFKSSAELLHEYRTKLGNVTADKVVHMCGSGVTACHNLLAMEIAGLTGSSLYPGSWSEWIRNPGRPVLPMPLKQN